MQQNLKTEKQMIEFGKKIAKNLLPGDILCLYGNLGTGKTTLTKGVALGLNVKESITSPTFGLINIYKIKNKSINKQKQIKNLIHVDTYRLKNEEDLIEIGIEDYLGAPDTICVIEWPEKIKNLLKNKKTISVKIEHVGENERDVSFM